MSVAVDNFTLATGSSNSGVTFAHTVGAGANLLVVTTGRDRTGGNASISGITYNGVALTQQILSSEGGEDQSIWTLVNPATGSNNVVVSWSGGTSEYVIGATSFTGVDTSTPVGTSVEGSDSFSDPSIDVSSETDGMVIDNVKMFNRILTVGTGQTQKYNQTGGSNYHYAGSVEAGAATVTMSWSASSSGSWRSLATPIKPGAAAPMTNFFRRRVG